jgi:large subunit ribosomal protein L10
VAVNKQQRQDSVETLSHKIAEATAGFVINYQGLNAEATNDLRRQVRKAGSELKVAKNTLLRRAAQQTDFATLSEKFVGPTAVVFVKNNPVPVVKVLKKFIKDNPTVPLQIKAGVLADLPSREVLLGQLVGVLSAPARALVTVLSEVPRKFLRVLNAIAEKQHKP